MKHVTFGTSCMGRLEHLQEFYINNIKTGLQVDPKTTFTLLNYNSKDGMHEWVMSELREYISKGVVKYIRTQKPSSFVQAHTKNITMKNSNNDIVCNLDADNKLTEKYMNIVIDRFNSKNKHTVIIPGKCGPKSGLNGRICCLKDDFIAAGGFDERMTGWGFEDNDFIHRISELFELNLTRLSDIMTRHEFVEMLGETCQHVRCTNESNNNNNNRERSINNIKSGKLVANQHVEWGTIHD